MVACLCFGGYAGWARGLYLSPADRAVRPLAEALGTRSVYEPKLAGGLSVPRPARGRRSLNDADDWRLLAAASEVRRRAEEHPTPENRRALAIAHLFAGETTPAVELYRELLGEAPRSAILLSELAAALLIRSEASGLEGDRVEALDRALEAVDLSSDLPEARFNLALAQGISGLSSDARESFRSLLALSRVNAGTKADALRNAQRLDRDHRQSRDAAQGGLLHQRFDASLADWLTSGEASRHELETEMAKIGEAYAGLTSDGSLREAAREAVDARAGKRSGYEAYAAGRKAYDASPLNPETYAPSFRRAAAQLGQGPIGLWSSLHVGIAEYWSRDLARAQERFLGLRTRALRNGYVRLAARSAWMLGLVEASVGGDDQAASWYQDSGKLFDRALDSEGRASVDARQAEILGRLGRRHDAWALMTRSLTRLEGAPWSRRHGALLAAALAAKRDGLPRAAIAFQREAVDVAVGASQPIPAVEALLYEADLRTHFGLFGAEAVLQTAQALLGDIRPPHDRLLAEWAIRVPVRGVEGLEDLRHKALAARQFFLGLPGSTQMRRVAQSNLQLARIARAAGQVDTAKSLVIESMTALAALAATRNASDRPQVLEAARDALDEAIRIEGDPYRLARLVDQYRCSQHFEPRLCTDVTRFDRGVEALGRGGCLIFAIPSEEKGILLSYSQDGWARRNFHVKGLAVRLDGILSALESGTPRPLEQQLKSLGADLFQGLQIGPCQRVYIEAFGDLARLPPHLWWIPEGKSFLGRDRSVTTLATVQAGAQSTKPDAGIVLVSQATSPGFARLGYADKEVEDIAALFGPTARVHVNSMARADFLKNVETAGLLHFAGHGFSDVRDPRRSFLALSDLSGPSRVFATDLDGVKSRASLVVLSACSTGGPGRLSSSASLGLAGSLLSAGAAEVVAPLVDVDDQSTREAMKAFYRALRGGQSPSTALLSARRSTPDLAHAAYAFQSFSRAVEPVTQ